MSEPVLFRSISIEAFRGFRDRRHLPIEASVAIIGGPNGTGKTSLFDAIHWLLIGRLDRLRELRLRQTDEYVVNQYRLPGPALVEAEVRIGGQLVRLARSGDSRATLFEWEESTGRVLRGIDAEEALEESLAPSTGITLATALLNSGLLQQDDMRSVLESKPSDRFSFLNRLLGLELLEDFETAARAHARASSDLVDAARAEAMAARSERETLEEQLGTLESRLADRPSVEDARANLDIALGKWNSVVDVAQSEDARSVVERRIATDANIRRARIERLLPECRALERALADVVVPSQEEVTRVQGERERAQTLLSQRAIDLEAALNAERLAEERADQLSRLAAIAVPLLTDQCPVCTQPIDPVHVARQLDGRAADTGDLLALRESRGRAEALKREAETDLTRADQALTELTTRAQDAAELDIRRQNLAAEVRDIALSGDAIRLVQLADPSRVSTEHLELALEALREIGASAERLVALLESNELAGRISLLKAEVETLAKTEAARRKRVEELAERSSQAKRLQDAITPARVSVVEQRVRALRPLVADIYSRLDPHPSFKELDLDHSVYRSRGTTLPIARDALEGREANPALIFSTSQANIVALSYFLAMGWAAGTAALPFVLMDDPLQSMDDVNVLGFSDLCRFVRSERQLLISTHERRFSGLLERKLAPRAEGERTLAIKFLGWDRSGPAVEVEEIAPQLREVDLQLAPA